MESFLDAYISSPGMLDLGTVDADFFVKQMLRSCVPCGAVDQLLPQNRSNALLLSGETGNGKRTLARALAVEFKKVSAEAVFVSMSAWVLEDKDDEVMCGQIRRCFEEMISMTSKIPVLIFVEDFEQVCDRPAAAWIFGQYVQSLLEHDLPCTLICALRDASVLTSNLRNLFVLCHIENPSTNARTNYFKRILTEFDVCEKHLTAELMAQIAYGFTYAQLEMLFRMVLMKLKQELVGSNHQTRVTKKMFEETAGQLRKEYARSQPVTFDMSAAAAVQSHVPPAIGQTIPLGAVQQSVSDTLRGQTEETDTKSQSAGSAEGTEEKTYMDIFEGLEDIDLDDF